MATSPVGNPHNTLSMPTALVLQDVYHRNAGAEFRVSTRQMARQLKTDRRTVVRAITRLSRRIFLEKLSDSEPGKLSKVFLNMGVIKMRWSKVEVTYY